MAWAYSCDTALYIIYDCGHACDLDHGYLHMKQLATFTREEHCRAIERYTPIWHIERYPLRSHALRPESRLYLLARREVLHSLRAHSGADRYADHSGTNADRFLDGQREASPSLSRYITLPRMLSFCQRNHRDNVSVHPRRLD